MARVGVERVTRRMTQWLHRCGGVAASSGYEVLDGPVGMDAAGLDGWREMALAARQDAAMAPMLDRLRRGDPREDFRAAAAAVQATGVQDPFMIEVGCASGWNYEVLTRLLKRPLRYLGVDYAPVMVQRGRERYPEAAFVVGDAAALPLRDACCDILLSGTVLMHLRDYEPAIRESRRVTRRWCIFHTVPMLRNRPTTMLRKRAYGLPVLEVVFHEQELRDCFARHGLHVRKVLESLPYDLAEIIGEHTVTRTFVCERIG